MIEQEPLWLSEKSIKAIHEILIARTGGVSGLLSQVMLESTLTKPINLYYYGDRPSIFRLAAAYGYGFIKNHCFVDGNKRIALAAVSVFLMRNGYRLTASEIETVDFFLNLAATTDNQEKSINCLTEWLENHSEVYKKG